MYDPRQPPAPARALWVTAGVSVLLHLLLGWGLGLTLQASDAVPVSATPPAPPRVDFELVESPESAQVDEAPENARFVSDRDTRAQDLADLELPATGRPHAPETGEGHERRQQATAPRPGSTPTVTVPSSPSRPQPPVAPNIPEPVDEPAEAPAEEPEESRQPEREEADVTVAAPSRQPAERQQAQPPVPPSPQQAPSPGEAPSVAPESRQGEIGYSEAEEDMLADALARGEFSNEASRHLFADYYLAMRREIERTWNLLLTTRYTGLDASRAVIDFTIRPDGSLGSLVVQAAEGDTLFPVVGASAIQRSAPFGPRPVDPRMPPELQALPLRIRVNFTYQ